MDQGLEVFKISTSAVSWFPAKKDPTVIVETSYETVGETDKAKVAIIGLNRLVTALGERPLFLPLQAGTSESKKGVGHNVSKQTEGQENKERLGQERERRVRVPLIKHALNIGVVVKMEGCD